MDLNAIQQALIAADLDGWLFYDFRGSDPIASSVLGLDPAAHTTRRWFYFVPARGEPMRVVHSIERGSLDAVPGRKLVYLPWQQLHEHLRGTLAGARRVAMQYSPLNAIPYVSRVDAGTVELVRSFGVAVVSSADLVAQFEATWSAEQFQTHLYAADKISRLIDDSFAEIGRRVLQHGSTTEYDIQQFMWDRYAADGLVSDHPPIVAVNANSADPHYFPTASRSSPIRAGDFVLLDTWAKQDLPPAVYFDVTWVGFLGDRPPTDITTVFNIVRDARDAAIRFVQDATRAGTPICGWQVDDAARSVIQRAGFGDHFIHRTGHSIHTSTHGNGANMDNLETRDERRLLPRTCFSIEPGIYLEGRFGVRSEVNVFVKEAEAIVTGRPAQSEIVPVQFSQTAARLS
jgi:Xaa-Pro aminopeptidase